MSFSFTYPNTPYYLPTTTNFDISINITGTQPSNVVYKISSSSPNNSLPSGLSIDPVNGSIIGKTSFTSISPLKNYIIDASSAIQIESSANLSILVDITPEFVYPLTPYTLTKNKSYTGTNEINPNYTFSNKVGTIYSLITTPLLTDISLNLDSTNGNIFGTPNISSNLTSYTIRANNQNITYDTIIQISVEILPTIIYPNNVYTLTQNEPVSIIPNQLSGNTTPKYSINCSLPSGLILNTNTGEISGTPTILTTYYEYRIRVVNAIGEAFAFIKLNVVREFLAPPVFATENVLPGDFITNPAVQMRRKAEILQYKENSSRLTKLQYLSLLARGKGPYSKRVWATQGDAFTSPNTSGLAQDGTTLVCNSPNSYIQKPSSASNVPGPVINLFLDPNVQPNGYRTASRNRVDIGFKWPFSSGT